MGQADPLCEALIVFHIENVQWMSSGHVKAGCQSIREALYVPFPASLLCGCGCLHGLLACSAFRALSGRATPFSLRIPVSNPRIQPITRSLAFYPFISPQFFPISKQNSPHMGFGWQIKPEQCGEGNRWSPQGNSRMSGASEMTGAYWPGQIILRSSIFPV